MWENVDQKNTEYGHVSHSGTSKINLSISWCVYGKIFNYYGQKFLSDIYQIN